MIQKGSEVEILTSDAHFALCEIVSIGKKAMTVSWKVPKENPKTGRWEHEIEMESIALRKVVYIKELL
jgi:hypothetical protein